MRCKVGDLAVIVNDPYCGGRDVGVIVTVLGQSFYVGPAGPGWICRGARKLAAFVGPDNVDMHIPDAWLRPIRDEPGADETLGWRALPSPIEIIQKELS